MRTRELKKELEVGKELCSCVQDIFNRKFVNDCPKLPCTLGDVCAVCCDVYVDDVDDNTGEIVKDCKQCTDDDCGVWSHVDCLEKEVWGFICGVCLNLLFN